MRACCGDDGGKGVLGVWAEIKLYRDAGIEPNTRDRGVETRGGSKPKSVAPYRSGEDQRQPGGAAFEIMQGFRFGCRWIRMIHALHDLPGPGRPSRDRSGVRPLIQRLNRHAVISLGDQRLVE